MPPRFYTADDFRPLGNGFSYNSFDGSITFNTNRIQEEMYRQILGITNNTKETKKMEAKKCDRCGKLYEMPTADENGNGAEVRFKYKYIRNADNMSEKAIIEEQRRNIYIKCGFNYSDDFVDLCPECRKSLKKWFEGTDKEEKK